MNVQNDYLTIYWIKKNFGWLYIEPEINIVNM